jgi:hypothetical protein
MQISFRLLLHHTHRWPGHHPHGARSSQQARPHDARPLPRAGRAKTKRYKYQALVSLLPHQADGPESRLPGPVCHAVVRARHPETHLSKFFSALVTTDEGELPGKSSMLVTLVLVGDDADDYLTPGEHFTLVRGRDVARGTVTRRLYV